MLSAQHTSTEVQPAADHALPYILYAEGRLGKPNFIHYQTQPSRSMKEFKRAENNNNESVKVRFSQTTTVIDDRVILIGGCESLQETEDVLPSNLLVLNSTSLIVNEQNAKLPVSGHGAAPIRGSRILITFGIQTMTPQKTFAAPIQEFDANTMNAISSPQFNGEVPQQRYYHTTTKIDDSKIYIYGGKNKDEKVLGDIFYIDLNSNSWNLIEQPSHPIAGHSSILVNNYLISCFGVDANAKVVSDCNIFDISTNSFIQSKTNEPPIPRTLSSMVSFEHDKSIVYIFGGIDENGNGLNDLYKLDASKAPILSWSSTNVNAKATKKLIPSGRGAHSAFTIGNTGLMMIWGGISNKNLLADPNFYFYDIKGNIWVDENFYKENTVESKSTNVAMIVGIIGIVVLIFGFVCFFIIRKRKFRIRKPYNRPGDQFGSNIYLIDDKQMQFKILDEPESIPEPTPQPVSTLPLPLPSLPTKIEKEPDSLISSELKKEPDSLISNELKKEPDSLISNELKKEPDSLISNDSVVPTATPTTTPKRMSFGKLESKPDLMNTGSTHMKRTHRRTSSVSLTSSELANITRSRNFTHHKSSLSASNITSSVNLNNQNSRRSSSRPNFLDPVSEKGSDLDSFTFNHRNSGTSDRSVNSIQWVGFNSSMIDGQEENRNALHVRNLSSKQQDNSSKYHKNRYSSDEEDNEYIINGDYIDTFSEMKNNYNRDIFDHDEVMTTYDARRRKNVPPAWNNVSVIPRQKEISKEYAASDEISDNTNYTSRESGVIDKFAHESPSSSNESSYQINEEEEGSNMKKSKRSSKRTSRVSFALKDEKIEFDENESSSTVSLARISGRSLSSQSSISSSATPSIIEEEEDDIEEDSELEDYFTLNNNSPFNPSPISDKSLCLYDDDKFRLDIV